MNIVLNQNVYATKRTSIVDNLLQQNNGTLSKYDAAINHQRALRIKFRDHSRPFHQSLKKTGRCREVILANGDYFSGRCRCREVAVVGRFKKESYETRKRPMDCPAGQKKSGRRGEVAVSGGSTVYPAKQTKLSC